MVKISIFYLIKLHFLIKEILIALQMKNDMSNLKIKNKKVDFLFYKV